ncbi:S24 family peptidase, partial [Sulfitobacter sp. HI0040]|uniref:S24 family peptidase n=1 Tax=Sulfitobacter sp. HI0040 TaxID=1822232 RepID=UPI00123749BB
MENADALRNAVKSIRERAGLSVRAMAAHLGMSPSGYSHYEQRIKDKSLPPKIAASIANVVEPLGVPREEVYDLTLGEIRDHSTFNSVLPTRIEADAPAENGQSLVPVYDVSASAGFGALVDYEEQTHSLAFPPDYLKRLTSSPPQNLAIISVKGESMEPTLVDDDIVLVDMSKTHMGFEAGVIP